MQVQDFPSRHGDPASRRLGTFSYLPPLTRAQIELQVEFMLSSGWSCAIEHIEPARAAGRYWYMWKLPMFGEQDSSAVLEQVGECASAYPDDHVRLVGYDARRQTQGLSFVVQRAGTDIGENARSR